MLYLVPWGRVGFPVPGGVVKAVRISCSIGCLGVFLASTSPALAQEAPEKTEVVMAVQTFFDAMTAGDSAAMSVVLVADGQYHRIRDDARGASTQRNTFAEFLRGLPSTRGQLLERMWDPFVLQHGPMAVLWAPYDFYVDRERSHCGVDTFTLVKTATGWKITSILYTVEQTNCPVSPLGPPQFRER